MSEDLFSDDDRDDEFDDAYDMDGPGLFDIPASFDEPEDEPVEAAARAPETGKEPALVAPQHSNRPQRTEPVSQPDAPLALYRRYRPDTFEDLIGQDHVTVPLQRALENNRVNHAYLFSGPRGCGKTTSARILARCLNCEQGPTATPCGVCQSCTDLARGGPGSIDVIEMDAASHGGVDDARDLRERAFFAPVHSRYKIYIVDEAHQVTNAGFNALLKLVEEPPPHVKFIFATTEPEKVIGTIRSRTHHYPFRLVPPKTLQSYLATLCESEGVAVEQAVLPLVVRAGAGSVRDSLSVLDQLLGGAGPEGVSYGQATALLGFTPDSLLDEIVDAFAAGDSAGVFGCIDKVMETGQDPRRFAEDLLRRLRDLVVVAAVPDATTSGLIDVADDQAQRLTVQAKGLGLGELTRAADVIASGITDMRGTTAPRLQLELMCARVLLPGADLDERGIHARLDRLERRISMSGVSAAPAPAVPAEAQMPQRSMPAELVEAPRPQRSMPAEPVEAPRPAEARPSTSSGNMASGSSQGAMPAEPVEAPRPAEASMPAGSEPELTVRIPTYQPAPELRPSASSGDMAPGRSQGAMPAEPVEAPRPAGVPTPALGPVSTVELRRMWPTVLDEVKRRKRFAWILLDQNAQVHEVADNVLTLAFSNAGARDAWGRGGNDAYLVEALKNSLDLDLRINAIVDEATTPARAQAPAPAVPAAPVAPQPAPVQPSTPAAEQSYSYANPRKDPEPEPSGPPEPAPAPSPHAAELAQKARDAIKPTVVGMTQHDTAPVDEPEYEDPSDPDVDVDLSADELMRSILGATPIVDEQM